MKEFIGKKCFLRIQDTNTKQILIYTGHIINVSDIHIIFIDKYDMAQCKLISEIIDIKEVA